MTIEQMCALKQEYGLSYEVIARETGVPLSTVSKVLTGVTKSPRRSTVSALTEYFQKLQAEYDSESVLSGNMSREDLIRALREEWTKEPQPECVHETGFPYDASGKDSQTAEQKPHMVTIEERDELPEENRTELIDGVLYDMSAPGIFHQELTLLLWESLKECIRKKGMNCRVLAAPTDVVLSERMPSTVVQPDVFVVCDKTGFRGKHGIIGSGSKYYGAPELVIEILSPSNRKKDAVLKVNKYLDAGVRELWLVDPDNRKVIVYDLDAYREPEGSAQLIYLYGFDQKVPVRISGGECGIDFPEITKEVDDYYG